MRSLAMRKGLALRGSWVLLLLFLTVGAARGQEARSLNVGPLLYTTNEAFTSDDIAWPRGWPATEQDMLEVYGILIGTDLDWTDDQGIQHPVKVAQVAHRKFSDQGKVVMPVPGAFKRVYRNPYPDKILDGAVRTDILAQTDPVDPAIPADVVIYNHATTWTGIDVERWIYAFAADEQGSYVIEEFRFANTSGEPRQDVYFGLTAETSANTFYPGDLWGNYYGATYAAYVAGDPMADSMRVWYSWDANEPEVQADNRAEPDPIWGNFQEPQFMTYAVLHADTSPGDERDDPSQPAKAGWSQRELSPNLLEATHQEIYDFLSTGWDTKNPGSYARTVNAEGQEVIGGMYRVLRPGIDLGDFDPETEQEKTVLFSFGPYQMQPGDDIRIVTAFAGGAIPHRLAIDIGRAYENGFAQQQPLAPLPGGPGYDVFDMHGNPLVRDGDIYDLQGNLLAESGTTLTKETKDAILDLSKEIALRTAAKARETWRGGDVRYGQGTFGIPLAPAAPSLEGFSENDQIRLKWGDEAANDTRAGEIVGYRIYRNYKRPPSITLPTDTTFFLLDEVGPGVREYVDTEVVRGEDYYYYVTAVSEAGLESSRFLNRTGTSTRREDEALAATRSPSEDWQESIVVVPNPYHVRAAQKYPGKRLNFLNLPAYADIHIYTMSGDLVQTLRHDAHTGDEDWERQDTFSSMEIVSGVYFYIVEELDGPNGSPTGRQAGGKFVVIK